MDSHSESAERSVQPPAKPSTDEPERPPPPPPVAASEDSGEHEKRVNSLPESTPPDGGGGAHSGNANSGISSAFSRFKTGLGLHFPSMASSGPQQSGQVAAADAAGGGSSATSSTHVLGAFESLAKGLVDTSRTAVKAVQVKARHAVSQNKRRYQEGGFDLDLCYITENIIAMGFPAGDLSSGLFGFFEGFYRNHMEEVIKFLESQHKDLVKELLDMYRITEENVQGKYKVYNLCSERLYDASRFEGKVACFPFDDHNCPPLQLITSFCQSAYSWLKEDIQNVVVVHCKAGMGRTGLMICSLLLFLKFFSTAEEAINYFNQKRCVDGKALVLPSQIRYVKYFERVLTYFNGENQPGRRCMLRGFKLHGCPYWIRPSITISDHRGVIFSSKYHPKTKGLTPEDFWISAPKKRMVIFAIPGEPGLTEVVGDFKIHFHDRQGDFYCWLNTTMTENRKTLEVSDLDGFEKRKLPSPGFQVELVMVDYDGTTPPRSKADSASKGSDGSSSVSYPSQSRGETASNSDQGKDSQNEDDVFSDSDSEETGASKRSQSAGASGAGPVQPGHTSDGQADQMAPLTHRTEQLSLQNQEPSQMKSSKEPTNDGAHKPAAALESSSVSDIKAIAADASVFTFGDEEDYESD